MEQEINMDKNPLISIIIAVYNGEKYLERAIKSVLSQSASNYELIIIDGNSTDSTIDIVKKYRSYISTFISEKDNGIYDAWNKGIKVAKGEWICFIGADDEFYPSAIMKYTNYLNNVLNYEVIDYVFSKVEYVNFTGKIFQVHGKPWKWNEFRKHMSVSHVGSLHSAKYFKKYGLFNDEYKIAGDYEMLLRAQDSLKAVFLEEKTVRMQIGGISSGNNYAVFKETSKAKIETGKRDAYLVKYEEYIAIAKLLIRKRFFKNH